MLPAQFDMRNDIVCELSDNTGKCVCRAILSRIDINCFFLYSLRTAPDSRRHGHATHLMREIVSRFGRSWLKLKAEPHEENMSIERLIAFYEKFGFSQSSGNYKGVMDRPPDEDDLTVTKPEISAT